MLARRLSLFLSVLAMCLLALACSLGWQGGERTGPPEAVQSQRETAQVVVPATAEPSPAERCQRLDDQLTECSDSIARVWRPATPPHYPEKVRRLLEIKKRYELVDEAGRACRGAPGAHASGAALEACLARTGCDAFATCVADNLDTF